MTRATILIVEDGLDISRLIAELLTREGFAVETADRGRAMDLVRQCRA